MRRKVAIILGLLVSVLQLNAWPARARDGAFYDAAYSWVNTVLSYIQGWPESQGWNGKGPSGYDDEYWISVGGGSRAWNNPETSNPGAFDCAGFVSWCAGLRQHVTTNIEWNQVIWLKGQTEEDLKNASKGDLLLRYGTTTGHIRIVDYYQSTNDWLYFVEANEGETFGVVRKWDHPGYLANIGYHLYNFIGDEKPDKEKILPVNSYTGEVIKEGGKYGQPFKLLFKLQYLPPSPLGYLLRINLVRDGTPGNYLLQHGFELECGKYQLQLLLMNWASTQSDMMVLNFEIVDVPQVIFTDPSDGEAEVDVYKNITITFNKEMDQSSVNSGTVQFSPALVGGFTAQWTGDGKTVTLTLNNPQQDLEFYINYWVEILDILKAWNFTNSGIEICSNFYIIL
uniref:SbsA Ig-like domain-containing protein n=1 Tax=candidate division WOR-3 bacterium TaxID=2052148 RepID=A0A7C6AGS3_UNCW3